MAALPEPQPTFEQLLKTSASESSSRTQLWTSFVRSAQIQRMAEIGVYRGDFAAEILRNCPALTAYYMLDPWRHLDDWNKPANHDNSVLDGFFHETMTKTDFAARKRIVLRGKTTEVADDIPDASLDFAYIDADHTLKGIAIDLIRVYPKVREGGFLGGDDFTPTVWEHSSAFEPTLVFPFAVYFAEAVGAAIYSLPYNQFCLQKITGGSFSFIDLTGKYGDRGLRSQFAAEKLLKLSLSERFPRLAQVLRKMKR